MELIRQSRLSVAPVRDEEWKLVLEMAEADFAASPAGADESQSRSQVRRASTLTARNATGTNVTGNVRAGPT